MTNINLIDPLEICLRALDHGADLESCLALFPALSDELRPILTAAVQSRSIAVTDVPEAVVRRGKARVLQAAAEMREQARPLPFLPFWRLRQKALYSPRFFRLAVTSAMMLVFLLTGGTGLVNASSSAVPGDHLYPVKRSWEGVQLFFVIDPATKVELEHEFDHERVQEIEVLYTEKRIAQVNFQGQVQSHNNGIWVIGGLNVIVNQNVIPGAEIIPGVTVQVVGETDDGVIKAQRIILLNTPTPVVTTVVVTPLLEPSSTRESTETESGKHSEMEKTPELFTSTPLPQIYSTETRRPTADKPDGNSGSAPEKSNDYEKEGD